MTTYSGGYLMLRQPLIKAGMHRHTAELDGPVSPLMLRALNIVQRTRWRVDPFIFQTMQEAWDSKDAIGEIPRPDDIPVPPKLPDSVWAEMTKDQRGDHKARLAEIYERNAHMVAKRESFLRKMQVAGDVLHEPAVWFPHNLDFRSRMYPLPQDLHTQGDDLAKSLLMFGRGLPLGKRGAFWLCVAIANAFGHDKAPLLERMDWTLEHRALLEDSVKNPLEGRRFWTEADEPWSALALARDFIGWLEDGDDYESHRPVNVDATCSGIQHLAALSRDPVSALSTNLTRCPERQDIYGEVASEVVRKVERDAAAGVEAARSWLGNVTRNTVKRAVMTTPYGCTDRGMRDQLIEDGHCADLDGKPIHTADYMKECIKEALSQTAHKPKEVMAYLQGVAKVLARKDRPLVWTTPVGMRVRQAYYNRSEKRILTLFGESSLWSEDKKLGLNERKQSLAAAPNFVHSFDAAHLAATVEYANSEYGIDAFAMIHDSYGTHAARLDDLNKALRLTFVDLYAVDRLSRFADEIAAAHPDVELPTLPEFGTFDVREVLEAPFFFS